MGYFSSAINARRSGMFKEQDSGTNLNAFCSDPYVQDIVEEYRDMGYQSNESDVVKST